MTSSTTIGAHPQFFLVDGTFLAGESLGIIPTPWETAFQNRDIEAIRKLYILGRLVSVLAGLVGTFLVVLLGTWLAGRIGGLAAGAAYTVAPLTVVEAHYLTNDVVMSVLVLGSVLCAVLAVQRVRVGWLFSAGLLLGLGIADKYSAIFAAPAVGVAQILIWRAGIDPRPSDYAPKCLSPAGTMAGRLDWVRCGRTLYSFRPGEDIKRHTDDPGRQCSRTDRHIKPRSLTC